MDHDLISKEKEKVQKDLLKLPGVHSVAIGYKVKAGKETKELAIVVFTEKKKAANLLKPEEVIKESYGGVPTDVIEMPTFVPEADGAKYNPIPGGVQIAVSSSLGTLGTFVKSKKSGDNINDVYVLSNRHVLGASGTKIYHPTSGTGNEIATTARSDYYPKADAGMAKMNVPTLAECGFIKDIGRIGGIHIVTIDDIGKCVKKRGRTTLLTRGVIKYIEMRVSSGSQIYDDQILIDSLNSQERFNDPGDSGSAILMDKEINGKSNLIISLHWGGSEVGNIKRSVSSPIQAVLESLQAEIILSSFCLDITSMTLPINAMYTLKASGGVVSSWTSSDSSVAIVDNGKVMTNASGTTVITAKTTNGQSTTCKITVSNLRLGDVNNDGCIDLNDVLKVQKHVAKTITLTGKELYAADVNGDGVVDSKDVQAIQEYIAKFFKHFTYTPCSIISGTISSFSVTIDAKIVKTPVFSGTEYGFYWGKTNRSLTSKVAVGTKMPTSFPCSYSTTLTGLSAQTTYYYRTYIKTTQGEVLGEIKDFKTPEK